MFTSLRARLLLTYFLLTGLVLALVGISLFIFLWRNPPATERIFQVMEGTAETIQARAGRQLAASDPEVLNNILVRLGLPGSRVITLGSQGEVLSDSRSNLQPPSRELLARLAGVKVPTRGEYGGISDSRWVYLASPISPDRTLLLLSPRPRVIHEISDELLRPLLQAAAVSLIVSVAFAWLIAHWVAGPLQKTALAARAVAAGDYDQQLTPSGPEEARSLAGSFNEMIQQVRANQQAMRDFVANVSHELKTPLTSITGFAQALLDKTASEGEARERAARVIFDESNRLRRLVDDLLDLARLDSGQMSFERGPIQLNAILETVVEKLSIKAHAQGVRLQSELSEVPVVVGDGDRLAQVFTNLVDNGINHTPAGGEIWVKTRVDQQWVTIDIEDTGKGIPEHELSRIFERFYRLDKARTGGSDHGTGLGLAISHEIIQAHGGLISARSKPGVGSRFTIRLPFALPQDETLARSTR